MVEKNLVLIEIFTAKLILCHTIRHVFEILHPAGEAKPCFWARSYFQFVIVKLSSTYLLIRMA